MKNFPYNLEEIIRKIIFTDECRICGCTDCSKRWFRCDDYSNITTISTEKFSISVMIFATIGYDYKSDIYFIDECLNTDKNINLLETFVANYLLMKMLVLLKKTLLF